MTDLRAEIDRGPAIIEAIAECRMRAEDVQTSRRTFGEPSEITRALLHQALMRLGRLMTGQTP